MLMLALTTAKRPWMPMHAALSRITLCDLSALSWVHVMFDLALSSQLVLQSACFPGCLQQGCGGQTSFHNLMEMCVTLF